MTPEDKLRYVRMAALPEMITILRALTAWKAVEAYYSPEFNEEAALADPAFATLIERIWQASYRSATHNEKDMKLEQIIEDPAIALRASTQYKLSTFLPSCTSYDDFRQKASEHLSTFHQTHPKTLMHLSGLDWNIPFAIPGSKPDSEQTPPPPQQQQTTAPDSASIVIAIAATDAVRSILKAINEGKKYVEKYYPEREPFLEDEARKDPEFLGFLHNLFSSINRSLGRDPSTKDIRKHGAAGLKTLETNIARSTHFRLSQIVAMSPTREAFEKYVELTIPNYAGSVTKLFNLGGFSWDLSFTTAEKREFASPAQEASLFCPENQSDAPKAPLHDDIVTQVQEALIDTQQELSETRSELDKMKKELQQMERLLAIVISKSAIWNKPLTNEEIALIARFIG